MTRPSEAVIAEARRQGFRWAGAWFERQMPGFPYAVEVHPVECFQRHVNRSERTSSGVVSRSARPPRDYLAPRPTWRLD